MSSGATIEAFFDTGTSTVSYVVSDEATQAAAIVDPVLDYDFRSGHTNTRSADTLLAYVKDRGLDVQWILETHAHADHFSAACYLQEFVGGGMPDVSSAHADFLPSLQVNLMAGRLPAADENGIAYLRIPLNAFPKHEGMACQRPARWKA